MGYLLLLYNKLETGLVIEFKKADKQKLEDAVDSALLQIQDKQYAQELRAQGVKILWVMALLLPAKSFWLRV